MLKQDEYYVRKFSVTKVKCKAVKTFTKRCVSTGKY